MSYKRDTGRSGFLLTATHRIFFTHDSIFDRHPTAKTRIVSKRRVNGRSHIPSSSQPILAKHTFPDDEASVASQSALCLVSTTLLFIGVHCLPLLLPFSHSLSSFDSFPHDEPIPVKHHKGDASSHLLFLVVRVFSPSKRIIYCSFCVA